MGDLERVVREEPVPATKAIALAGKVTTVGPVRSRPAPLLAKLEVGAVDDPLEQEADDLADRVVASLRRMANPPLGDTSTATRLPAHTRIRRSASPATDTMGAAGGPVDEVTESKIRSSSGVPLPSATKRAMEDGFGADFSDVRLHTNSRVAPLLGAVAFTTGTDIHLAPGRFEPDSSQGQHLLAHELTHVLQQSEGTRRRPLQRVPDIQRSVTGGTVGDRVKHESGDLFTISAVEKDGSDTLYVLAPDKDGKPVRVFGDVKTYELTSTTKATTGGIVGITLDVTHSVARTKCDGLQAVQVWWGSHSTIGVKVGKLNFNENKTDYEAFVDGGKNSPFVTLSGEQPAHATKPYYLTAGEVASQVTWDGENGTIRVYDQPTAVVHFDEMNFETAIVAINVDGKGTDRVLKVFTWGWTKQGATPTHAKGDEIAGKSSGIKSGGAVSSKWRMIVAADYPDYTYE